MKEKQIILSVVIGALSLLYIYSLYKAKRDQGENDMINHLKEAVHKDPIYQQVQFKTVFDTLVKSGNIWGPQPQEFEQDQDPACKIVKSIG